MPVTLRTSKTEARGCDDRQSFEKRATANMKIRD
ncbi:hypothetical protein FHS92_001949 [Sphingobium subterraneum]|uniref:Uncharacterized protein n=1 Tax=Sphingobium subterraneum TaxID=627688 RepID=A0A841J0R3_9SPHN|nr:hypothetical protein [Sphingobium subterraneum]